jgi:hypothetical protein
MNGEIVWHVFAALADSTTHRRFPGAGREIVFDTLKCVELPFKYA